MYIDIDDLYEKYNKKITGVLHVGAHEAEEAEIYEKNQVRQVIWIEGNSDLIANIKDKLKAFKNQAVYNELVSDSVKEVAFNITNNNQSSSILPLGTHTVNHPSVLVERIVQKKTTRLDTFFEKNSIDISNINFINLDIQGAELLALKGLGKYLDRMDYVYTEINITEVYEGCPLITDLDKFLGGQGFSRVKTYITRWEWGDALYFRNKARLPIPNE
jgi:FkbM family methyltransferase